MNSRITPIQVIKDIFTDSSPVIRLLAVIIIMGTCYLIFTFIGLLLAMLLFSFSWQELQNLLSGEMQEVSTGFLYYMQGLQSIGLFIVPAILVYILILRDEAETVFTGKRYIFTAALLVIVTLIFSAPLLQKLIEWNESLQLPASLHEFETTLKTLEEERVKIVEQLLSGKGATFFLINILVVSILPALGEELFFRGILQTLLTNWFRNLHVGILATAVVFSAAHLQFYGFLPRLILGMYFGYLFFWSKNIWIPILAHFFNNSIAVFLSFIVDGTDTRFTRYLSQMNNTSALALCISIVLTVFLILLTRRWIAIKMRTRILS